MSTSKGASGALRSFYDLDYDLQDRVARNLGVDCKDLDIPEVYKIEDDESILKNNHKDIKLSKGQFYYEFINPEFEGLEQKTVFSQAIEIEIMFKSENIGISVDGSYIKAKKNQNLKFSIVDNEKYLSCIQI